MTPIYVFGWKQVWKGLCEFTSNFLEVVKGNHIEQPFDVDVSFALPQNQVC